MIRRSLLTLLFLSALVFCQNYVPATAEIEVIIPDNNIVTRVSIFVEVKDTQPQILLRPGMTLAEVLALNPQQVSLGTSMSDTIITSLPTISDGKFWCAGVFGFNAQDSIVTEFGLSTIVQAPLAYEKIYPTVKIIFK